MTEAKAPLGFHLLLQALVVVLVTSASSTAQDTLVPLYNRVYEIKLVLRNGEKREGYLKQVTDSAVVYTDNKTPVGAPALASDKFVGYADLKKVKLLRNGAVGRGALIGVFTGITIGAVGGYVGGSDTDSFLTPEANAVAFALVGTIPGALIGAVVGHIGKTYIIKGTKEGLAALRQAVSVSVYGRIP